MNAEAITPLAAALAKTGLEATAAPAADAGFAKLISDGLGSVNQQLLASEAGLQQLAAGKVENLHQLMIQMQEARLSFDLLMQVRTRLLEAYQDVMRMQI